MEVTTLVSFVLVIWSFLMTYANLFALTGYGVCFSASAGFGFGFSNDFIILMFLAMMSLLMTTGAGGFGGERELLSPLLELIKPCETLLWFRMLPTLL